MESWNGLIFDNIKIVNRNLNMCNLPEKASRMLYDMEACLCSGDGLTEGSAFRAENRTVADRVLGMTGMPARVGDAKVSGDIVRFRVEPNGYGISDLYFKVRAK